jgi:ABC-type branched-subunit amino acid transport system ATPase component
MLTLTSLSRAFGGLRVIDGLDLTVEAGEILGILGPNGAGKSTLFNLIGGVLPPSSGRILLDGREGGQDAGAGTRGGAHAHGQHRNHDAGRPYATGR